MSKPKHKHEIISLLAGGRRLLSSSSALIKRNMATVVPATLMNQLKATNGKSITCKAAVAWKPKAPLDVTDIQVNHFPFWAVALGNL